MMEHSVSTIDMMINLAVQVGQILLFFGIFIYVYGAKISAAIVTRQAKERKLAEAELEYERIISDAQEQYNLSITEALAHKKRILEEASQLGQTKVDEMLAVAQKEIDHLKTQAQQSGLNLQSELEAQFEVMVKQTAQLSLQKLMGDKQSTAHDEYLDTIIKQAT